MRCPYHDCKCQFHDLSNPNPNCTYLIMKDIKSAKKGNKRMKMLELNITSQFPCMTLKMKLTEKSLPPSDNIHGPYKMMPITYIR